MNKDTKTSSLLDIDAVLASEKARNKRPASPKKATLSLEKASVEVVKETNPKTRSKKANKALVTRRLNSFQKADFSSDKLDLVKSQVHNEINASLNDALLANPAKKKSLANRAFAAVNRLKAAQSTEEVERVRTASIASLNAAIA